MADRLNVRLVVSATDRASGTLQGVRGQLRGLGDSATRLGTRFRGIGERGLTRLTLPVAGFAGAALAASGTIEQMTVGFQSLLGGAKPAADQMQRLTAFSARLMLNAGVGVGKLQDELRMIGDIAAGAQVPLGDMAAIYAKGMSKGKIQTEELNQLTERGVPILDAMVELAAKYGKTLSKEDVYKAAEKGQIQFRHLREALGLLTAEGGKFHGQMELQSGTLFGLWSTLKDNVFLLAADVGKSLDEAFGVKDGMRELIKWVGDAREGFKSFSENHPELFKLGASIGGIAAAAPLLALGLGAALPLLRPLARGFRLLTLPVRASWRAVSGLRRSVDRGAGSMRVSGVTGPLGQVRAGARLTNRGVRAMGATVAAGAGSMRVSGVTGPLAQVRTGTRLANRGIRAMGAMVAAGTGRLPVSGVTGPLGQVRTDTRLTNRGVRAMGATVAAGAGSMRVSGVTGPLAQVRTGTRLANRGIRAMGAMVAAGTGRLPVSGVTGPLGQVRTDTRLTNRGVRAMGATVAAGAGSMRVSGVTGPLAQVRTGTRLANRGIRAMGAMVAAGTGRLPVSGVTGPLGQVRTDTRLTNRGVRAMGATIAAGAGSMRVSGVTGPLAQVRTGTRLANRGIRAMGAMVAAGTGRLPVSGVTGPLGQVRTDTRLTNRGVRAMGATIAAGAGRLPVSGVTGPLATARDRTGRTGRRLGALRNVVAGGLGRLGIAGVTGPLATVRQRSGLTSRLLGGLRGGVRGGLPILGVAGVLAGLGKADEGMEGTKSTWLSLGDTAATMAAFMGGPVGIVAGGAWTIFRNWDRLKALWGPIWESLRETARGSELLTDLKDIEGEIAGWTARVGESIESGIDSAEKWFRDSTDLSRSGVSPGASRRVATRPAPFIFSGPGPGELATPGGGAGPAQVGGVIRLAVDVRGGADVRATELRSANPDVPIELDVGELELSP